MRIYSKIWEHTSRDHNNYTSRDHNNYTSRDQNNCGLYRRDDNNCGLYLKRIIVDYTEEMIIIMKYIL